MGAVDDRQLLFLVRLAVSIGENSASPGDEAYADNTVFARLSLVCDESSPKLNLCLASSLLNYLVETSFGVLL